MAVDDRGESIQEIITGRGGGILAETRRQGERQNGGDNEKAW